MSVLDASPISQLDKFNIVGKWGDCVNSLNYQGTLDVHNGQYLLSIYDHDSESLIRGPFNNSRRAYGKGIMNGYKDNEEFHIPVKINLFIECCIKSNTSGNTVGLYNYHVYKLSSIILGNKFCTNSSTFQKIFIYITNFSNFISKFMSSNIINNNKSSIILRLPNSVNQNVDHFNLSDSEECLLMQRHYHREISGLTHRFTGFQNTYLIGFEGYQFSVQDVNNCIEMIPKWFSLLLGIDETDYRALAFDGDFLFNFMNTQKLSSYHNNDNNNFALRLPNCACTGLLHNIFMSLKNWIKLYPRLNSIFNNLNLRSDSTIDQKLQNICVDFQMIYDHFYKKIDINGGNNLFEKINYVLSKMDQCALAHYLKYFHVKESTKKIYKKHHSGPIFKKLDKQGTFAEKIRKFRNGLSHDTSESFLKNNPDRKALFLNALRNLVRCWLLKEIGIDDKYMKILY